MAVLNWGDLTKSQEVDETIEEAIARLIVAHKADEEAHLAEGESLESHKAAEVIDHLADSVVTDKLEDEAVENVKILKMARAYKFIVDAGGDGDFTDIQDAIDAANADGGGVVFIKNGTYILSVILNLYSNITLKGESPLGVKIVFDTINKGIQAVGDVSPYSTGTLSVNNNSDQVVGVDTLWSANVAAGQYISLDNMWFEIKSVEDNTHLTLLNKYRGVNLSGENYRAADFKTDITVQDISIEGDGFNVINKFSYTARCIWHNIHGVGSTDIYLQHYYSVDGIIEDSDGFRGYVHTSNRHYFQRNFISTSLGNWFQYNRDSFIINNVITSETNSTIDLLDSKRVVINNNVCRVDASGVIEVTRCEECVVTNNYCFDGTSGIYLGTSVRCRVIGNYCEGGTSIGIRVTATSTHNVITNNVITNFVLAGIRLSTDCDYNIVANNNIKTVGVTDTDPCIYLYQADYNNIIGNICLDSTQDGIRVYNSDYNIVTGNQCKDNDAWGINITSSTSDKNVITNNQLLGNTSGALSDSGTGTIKANNVVA